MQEPSEPLFLCVKALVGKFNVSPFFSEGEVCELQHTDVPVLAQTAHPGRLPDSVGDVRMFYCMNWVEQFICYQIHDKLRILSTRMERVTGYAVTNVYFMCIEFQPDESMAAHRVHTDPDAPLDRRIVMAMTNETVSTLKGSRDTGCVCRCQNVTTFGDAVYFSGLREHAAPLLKKKRTTLHVHFTWARHGGSPGMSANAFQAVERRLVFQFWDGVDELMTPCHGSFGG
ncbi:hypothetical protein CYMTET_3679 [Cymbomonas tetramitiformis]|uniref:Uncharacterized protein n=1 Tax=Cymbomonas tetramitiformis TaxID=36881 RepID=A0AAE0H349_9CHLO|nr:hypothetical protein CYMTET_3679 [Cymbomonas tetramitiformis]